MPADFASAVTAWSTLALVAATIVLAWYTRGLLAATQSAAVVVTIEPAEVSMMHLELHVHNEGTAAARDVEVQFIPPLTHDLNGDDPPPSRFSVLRAGQKVTNYVGSYAALQSYRGTVVITWRSLRSGRRESFEYLIDMAYLKGSHALGTPALRQIADQLKKLREDWQWVAGGSRRLNVDAYSAFDRLRERRDRDRWERQQRRRREPPPSDPK